MPRNHFYFAPERGVYKVMPHKGAQHLAVAYTVYFTKMGIVIVKPDENGIYTLDFGDLGLIELRQLGERWIAGSSKRLHYVRQPSDGGRVEIQFDLKERYVMIPPKRKVGNAKVYYTLRGTDDKRTIVMGNPGKGHEKVERDMAPNIKLPDEA